KRGEAEQELATRVEALLQGDHTIALPGIVLQEILSGISDQGQREKVLRAVRQSFPLVLASEGDHLKAADLTTAAARKGIALSTPDALIAAQALNRRATLFTRDTDFTPLSALAGLHLL
ncbi:MAG TPA: PIN domain-containing protein, partial [Vicinamibacteria bacterium]|nr:PIN domain-containing protein [Vicinamibacteria bacterium]